MIMEWSAVKERLFRLERDTLVSAGAGSGKTAALVELYLRLLSGDTSLPPLDPSQIIAITFTDKAAQEMRGRIRKELRQRPRSDEERYRFLLRELPAAPITTFHAFCARLLRDHTIAAAVDPRFTVLDAFGASAELEGAMDELLQEEILSPSADMARLLHHFSLGSSDYGDGLRDVLGRLQQVAAPDHGWFERAETAALTHGEEAEVLFRRSVEAADGLMAEVERILTGKPLVFHKDLAPLPSLWRSTPLELADPELLRRLASLSACIGGNWGKETETKKALEAALDGMRSAAAQAAATPVTTSLLAMARRFAALYESRKNRRGALDFEDLQVKVRDLLRGNPAVLEEIQSGCRVVMVDEFQDTNPLQKEIVDLLRGPEQRLFVVGDPKQSIYLFRGADVSVFRRMQEEIEARGGEPLYFQESFRSRPGIISLVNDLFARLMTGGAEPYQTLFTDNDRLQAKRREEPALPCAELLQLLPGEEGEVPPTEADAVAERILSMVDGRSPVPVQRKEPESGALVSDSPRFGDMAILLRRFTHIKSFEQALRRRDIPYYVVKGKGFYQCQEIMDILSFLRCLESAADLPALAGVLRSPLCCVSDDTLFLLSRHPQGIGAWQSMVPAAGDEPLPLWLRIDADDRERLERLHRLLCRLRVIRDRLTVVELLDDILEATSFIPTLTLLFQGSQKVANIRKLMDLARSFDQRGEGTLRQFIAWLQKLVERDPTEAEALLATAGENAVALMTVHQSKGLEFPVVFVPECGAPPRAVSDMVLADPLEGIGIRLRQTVGDGLPTMVHQRLAASRRSKEDAEYRRLFYVAVTRARDYLVLSGEGSKRSSGSWRAWLEEWLTDGGNQLLIATSPPEPAAAAAAVAAPVTTQVNVEEVQRAVDRVLNFRPPLPSLLVFTPTSLEDYRLCPRKYYYKGVLGLDEGLFAQLLGRSRTLAPRRGRQTPEGATALSPLERGSLAHLMLQRLDFASPPATWEESCRSTAAGYHLPVPPEDLKEICRAVTTFAASPTGRSIAANPSRRELPFLLRLDGGAEYHLKGAMDLVVDEGDAVTVVDYKFSGHGGEGVEGYRFQVACYMLVLSKAFPGRDVKGKLVFLREGETETVSRDLAEFETELVDMMDDIRQRGDEDDFGTMSGCDGSRCPFRDRCFNPEGR